MAKYAGTATFYATKKKKKKELSFNYPATHYLPIS